MPSDIKTVALCVVGVLLICFIGYLSITKANLETKVAADASYIADLQNANTSCKDEAEKSNASLVAIKTQEDQITAKAEKNVAQAIMESKAYDAMAAQEASQKQTGAECDAIKGLVGGYFK